MPYVLDLSLYLFYGVLYPALIKIMQLFHGFRVSFKNFLNKQFLKLIDFQLLCGPPDSSHYLI